MRRLELLINRLQKRKFLNKRKRDILKEWVTKEIFGFNPSDKASKRITQIFDELEWHGEKKEVIMYSTRVKVLPQ